MSKALEEVARCFTLDQYNSPNKDESGEHCNPDGVLIDSIYIEGHADKTGSSYRNRRLSAERAINSFEEIVRKQRLSL